MTAAGAGIESGHRGSVDELTMAWDARKAAANRAKDGVSFEEAATVFGAPDALDGPDLRHSQEEPRLLRIGRAATGRVRMVAYSERHAEVRAISALPRGLRSSGSAIFFRSVDRGGTMMLVA